MGEQNILLKKTQKPSYVQRAYDGIRNLIIEEEISPGELLSENQLAAYLNMSRTPVREALKRLESEGHLEIISRKGAFLKSLTIDLNYAKEKIEKGNVARLKAG